MCMIKNNLRLMNGSCGSPKTEERNVKLWLYLLRYSESESKEGACLRRGDKRLLEGQDEKDRV